MRKDAEEIAHAARVATRRGDNITADPARVKDRNTIKQGRLFHFSLASV